MLLAPWFCDPIVFSAVHQSRIILFTLAQTLAFYLCGKFYFFLSLLSSHVRLFVIPWTAGWQTSLSFTISQSFHKLMSIELMMPYNHLILCWPLLLLPSIFPSIRVFSKEGGSSHQVVKLLGVSASASVLPICIQSWFPLGSIGLISLQSTISESEFFFFYNTSV